jgi:hypothetical protein
MAPEGWELVRPGDAALTLRIKKAGEYVLVEERKRRRLISLGVWAPRETVARIRAELAAERAQPGHAKRKAAAAKRRDREQTAYVATFIDTVLAFLAFPEVHADVARRLAEAVAAHATPVGSGTVARTKRIPVERRAEAALIAWLRHQTTGYDEMRIVVDRREVRQRLAEESRALLDRYRRGEPVGEDCPLQAGLARWEARSPTGFA